MRYRKPSLNNIFGITKAKKRFNRATSITAVKKPFRAISNAKRGIKRMMGYESGPMKFLRFLGRLFK